MSNCAGMPKSATIAISDMLDNCAKIQPGQEVVVLAHLDGLYGGDNLVDQEAISWIQSAIHFRGANASVFWIDEKAKPHEWRVPPIVKSAIESCDVFISHSFDLTNEEMMDFRKSFAGSKKILVRNFATTAPLLCTSWAQTPYELVTEIRYRASSGLKLGESWQVTDDNGTHLKGIIDREYNPKNYSYNEETDQIIARPRQASRPWPEWMHPLIGISETSGVLVFDRMLSWWSRYIGISPYFIKPIRLTVDNNTIIKIDGGDEADALRRFLTVMKGYLGENVYDFNAVHFGVHPQAFVGDHQCPNILHRRLIEHSHTSNVHFHIGAPKATTTYPYWMHCTGDIRNATFRVGETLIHDRGHLTALDHPAVLKIAEKYYGRPGVKPELVSY